MESTPRLEEPQQLNIDEGAAFQLTAYSCKCETLCLCIFNFHSNNCSGRIAPSGTEVSKLVASFDKMV